MPRRPGRPRIDENDSSTPVHLQLPTRTYDELYHRAQQARTTVPEIIRRVLARDRRIDDVENE